MTHKFRFVYIKISILSYKRNTKPLINKLLTEVSYMFHFAYWGLSAMLQSHKMAAEYIRPPFFDSQIDFN